MICVECDEVEKGFAKLGPQYLLCGLPGGGYCMVDAMACAMMEGQNAMVLQKVTGSDSDTILGTILKTIEILNEKAKNKT